MVRTCSGRVKSVRARIHCKFAENGKRAKMAKDGRQRGSNPCAPHSVEGVPPTSSVVPTVAFNQLSYDHLSRYPPLSPTHYNPHFLNHTCHHQNTRPAVPAVHTPSYQSPHLYESRPPTFHYLHRFTPTVHRRHQRAKTHRHPSASHSDVLPFRSTMLVPTSHHYI